MLGLAQVGLNSFPGLGRVDFTLAGLLGPVFFVVLDGFQKPLGLLVAALQPEDTA